MTIFAFLLHFNDCRETGSIESFSDFVAVGCPVMYPLIGFALAALGVALAKAIQFMRQHSPSRAMTELE